MRKVYVLAAKRTAIGTFGGSLKDTGAAALGTAVVQSLLKESRIDGALIDEVIFGNVLSAGLGQNVSRQIALAAGIPCETPSFTVNQVCASGMKAAQLAYQSIAIGNANVVVAGGTENMNQAPYLVKGARFGLRMNDSVMEDSMVRDGLWCALSGCHMGMTAENLAQEYGISREEQDAFAALSQQKTTKAIADGGFAQEIVPLAVTNRKETIQFTTDEHPRPGTTVEVLSRLRPAFKENGTVTAGNASGICDGAAGMILAGEEFVNRRCIEPIAEIIGFASAGVPPQRMGMGASAAVNTLKVRTGLTLDAIDLFELNEAFAAQALAVLKELAIDPDKVNVNGGALALGHPIGASGARIMVTLLHVLRKHHLETGIASLCVGGGMGMATMVRLTS